MRARLFTPSFACLLFPGSVFDSSLYSVMDRELFPQVRLALREICLVHVLRYPLFSLKT